LEKSERGTSITLNTLKDNGFKRIGLWKNGEKDNKKLRLTGILPEEMAVYLFVIGGKIQYVGKSENIRRRIIQYAKGINRGGRKVDKGVAKALEDGQNVGVYMYAITKKQQFFMRKGLLVDWVGGLERALILKLSPPWNGIRKEPKNEQPRQ